MSKRKKGETLDEFLDRIDGWDSYREKVDMFQIMVSILQDDTIADEDIRARLFEKIPREVMERHVKELGDWLDADERNAITRHDEV